MWQSRLWVECVGSCPSSSSLGCFQTIPSEIQIYLNHCSVLEIKLHYSSCCVNYKVFCLYLKSLYSDDILWLGFSGGSVVKNLPAMQEMQVWSLGREDLLEKEMATHSSVLAWEIPWTEEPGRLQSMRSQRVGHDLATKQQQILWLYPFPTTCQLCSINSMYFTLGRYRFLCWLLPLLAVMNMNILLYLSFLTLKRGNTGICLLELAVTGI